jgi:hypothetical protein
MDMLFKILSYNVVPKASAEMEVSEINNKEEISV